MLIVPLEYSNSLCELRNGDNRLMIVGKVGATTNEYLQVVNPYSKLPVIPIGETVRLQLYNDEIGFRMALAKVVLSREDFIRLSELRPIINNERRNFFRVFVRENIRACLLTENDAVAVKPRKNSAIQPACCWFEIFLINISLGGAYFVSRDGVNMYDKIKIELPVGNCETFNYRIVNITRLDSGKLGCGCVRLNESSKKTDLLCSYILDRQRRMFDDNSERY